MNYEQAVINKLATQGCVLSEAESTPASLAFIVGTFLFFLPRPGDDGGFSSAQWVFIQNTVEAYGLELLPLDQWLH